MVFELCSGILYCDEQVYSKHEKMYQNALFFRRGIPSQITPFRTLSRCSGTVKDKTENLCPPFLMLNSVKQRFQDQERSNRIRIKMRLRIRDPSQSRYETENFEFPCTAPHAKLSTLSEERSNWPSMLPTLLVHSDEDWRQKSVTYAAVFNERPLTARSIRRIVLRYYHVLDDQHVLAIRPLATGVARDDHPEHNKPRRVVLDPSRVNKVPIGIVLKSKIGTELQKKHFLMCILYMKLGNFLIIRWRLFSESAPTCSPVLRTPLRQKDLLSWLRNQLKLQNFNFHTAMGLRMLRFRTAINLALVSFGSAWNTPLKPVKRLVGYHCFESKLLMCSSLVIINCVAGEHEAPVTLWRT
ncbi:unnamed protein product [Nesidiocoris tenuis]|uniref:Uncharacterized protein n=1 Tax=Nesidiocoris tenuis TaxID=355587 RepID=A0A6H5HIF9_9HEMI|nr:unnamed protein product [Nesidiocoris tenuis]